MIKKDINSLNNLILEAVTYPKIEAELLDKKTRREILSNKQFSNLAIEILLTIDSNDLVDFMRQARVKLEEITNEEGSFIITSITDILVKWRFSPHAISLINRIATKEIGQPIQDSFVMHFSDDLSLSDALQIRDEIDQLYKSFMKNHGIYAYSDLQNRTLIDVREMRRGSLELFFIPLFEVLKNPIIHNLFFSSIYDILKYVLGRGYKHIMIQFDPQGKISVASDNRKPQIQPDSEYHAFATDTLIKRVTEQKFFAVGKYRLFTMGIEREEITEKRSKTSQFG